MRIKYFSDTGTLYVQFTDEEVVETKNFDEDIIVDLDKTGRLVGMTVEHASKSATLSEFSFQRYEEGI